MQKIDQQPLGDTFRELRGKSKIDETSDEILESRLEVIANRGLFKSDFKLEAVGASGPPGTTAPGHWLGAR